MTKRAFTLLELLLVMAVLVVIGALALPAIRASYDRARLVRSGELVRAQWNQARNKAMKSGQIQVFRFQPNTGYYQVEAWTGDDAANDNSAAADKAAREKTGVSPASLQPVAPSSTPTDPLHPAPPGAVELPEEVVFLDLAETAAEESDGRAAQVEQNATVQSGAGVWSRPILFYPDGSSSSRKLGLRNSSQFTIELTLRGLTGGALVSDPRRTSEVTNVAPL